MQEFLDRPGVLVFLLAYGWVILWIVVSLFVRKAGGRPIYPTPPRDALFVERWASGRSMRSGRTRLMGANNCLLVTVSKGTLQVRPVFPFTLGFLPELTGLDLDIPRARIQRVTRNKGLFGPKVLVEFSLPQGRRESVELHLRKTDPFLKALS